MNHKDFLNIPGRQDEEMSASQLTIGYWIASHRAELRKLGVGLFVAFDIIVGGYNIYHWTEYFLSGYFNDQRYATELVHTMSALSSLTASRAAAPLVIEGTTAYQSATGRFDAVALVQNPNKEWYVSFDYSFDAGNGTTPTASGFLIPGDEKPVGTFDLSGSYASNEPSFKLSNIHWRRISKHDIPHVTAWLGERNQFNIAKSIITQASTLNLIDGRLDFDLVNGSFYDYRDPEFLVGLWSGTTLSRVYKIHAPQLKAGETRHVEIAVPSNTPTSATVKLYPQIDFFDASVYLR